MTEQEVIEILTLNDEQKKTFPMLKQVYAIAVNALEEIQQYRAIGTVEECREAREKQMAMKPVEASPYRTISYYKCPICDEILAIDKGFCCNCGQALDWGSCTSAT